MKYILTSFMLLLSACSSSSNDSKTTTLIGNATIKMGATAATAMSTKNKNLLFNPPADGNWNLSPRKAKITFTRLDLVNSAGASITGSFSDCEVIYDLASASGSELADCELTLQITTEDGSTPSFAGDYIGVYIYYKRTIPVVIEDATNNFYSDSSSGTLLSTSPSTVTDDYVDFVVGGGDSSQDIASQVYFVEPFTLSDGEIPYIQITTDMIHTIKAQVDSGVPSFSDNSGQRPVELMAATSNMTITNEFYSDANSLNGAYLGGSGETYVRLFYADNIPVVATINGYIQNCTTGNSVSQAFAVNPSTSPAQDAAGNKAGGFLGIDNNNVYWALATDQKWTTYEALLKIQRQSTLNSNATFECQTMTSVPVPTGDTYTSDAPSISPTQTLTLKLLAK